MEFKNGIRLEEVEQRLLVRQYDDAYVARKWRLSDNTIELVRTAVESGLWWMIREQHPQSHARWPAGKGRVYLAFSPTRYSQWSVAIDSVNSSGEDFGKAVFNGKYHHQFVKRDIKYDFEKRNRKSGHMEVKRPDVLPTISILAQFDHSVLYLGRNSDAVCGFSTEYDIQRPILEQWEETPFSEFASIEGSEVPAEDGPNPRRIDILARNAHTGDRLVVELKRAEAGVEAIHQLLGYLEALGQRDGFNDGQRRGVIVAERIPDAVKNLAKDAGVLAYQISYLLTFCRVA